MKRSLVQMLALAAAILSFVGIFSLLMLTRPAGDGQESAQGGTPGATGTPSEDLAGLLYDRLVGFGVPVEDVRTIQSSPLQIQITLRTQGDQSRRDPDTLWYEFVAMHEAELSNINFGIHLSRYHLIVMDGNGQVIHDSNPNLESDFFPTPFAPTAPAPIGDEETQNLLEQSLDFRGLEIQSLAVSSDHIMLPNTKLVEMELTCLRDPNDQVNGFLGSLQYQIFDLNSQTGAQIAVTRVKIYEPDGRQLAEYILESPRGSEHFWLAEGIEGNWFPVPAVVEETPEMTPTPGEYPPPAQ